MQTLCRNFVLQIPNLKSETLVVRNLASLAQLACHDVEAIEAAKSYIKTHKISLRDACLVGWSLSILNAFDKEMVVWWVNRMDEATEGNTKYSQRRQFYQTLIHIYVLQPELGRYLDVDPNFEKLCAESWKERIRMKAYVSRDLLQIFVTLREMGFYCIREYYTFGSRLCISMALRKGFAVRICVICENGFWNLPNRLRGPQLWKQKILEQLGWVMLNIGVEEWNLLETRAEKHHFIRTRMTVALRRKRQLNNAIGS